MFESLFELTDKIKNMDSNEIAVKLYFDKDIQSFIITANRIDQLTQGLNSDGELIGTYKSEYFNESFTFEGKSYEKIVGKPYNFIDTGTFFRSFKIAVFQDGFSIVADTEKEDGDLIDKFGNNILGLTTESLDELVKKMLPLFIDEVRKEIFK